VESFWLGQVAGPPQQASGAYGASHNFFNTVWATDGDHGASGRDDYIPAADQQRLGKAWRHYCYHPSAIGDRMMAEAVDLRARVSLAGSSPRAATPIRPARTAPGYGNQYSHNLTRRHFCQGRI
jgi:hypothetical protein